MFRSVVPALAAALLLAQPASAQQSGVTALTDDDINCNDWLRAADGSWATVGEVKIRGVPTRDRKAQDAAEMALMDRKCGVKASEGGIQVEKAGDPEANRPQGK